MLIIYVDICILRKQMQAIVYDLMRIRIKLETRIILEEFENQIL